MTIFEGIQVVTMVTNTAIEVAENKEQVNKLVQSSLHNVMLLPALDARR